MEYLPTNLPQYVKQTSRTALGNSVVQSGHVLLFSEDGSSLTAKLPDGSFVTVGGSGGTDVSDTTATAATVLSGYDFYLANGTKTSGTIQTVTASQSGNIVTVPAGYIAAAQTLTIGTAKAAATYTPTTSDQTITAGQYLTGDQTIKGDANLLAANIVQGVTIFGVTGTASGGGSTNFYKCATVDTVNLTWTGYKAVFDSVTGTYSFESTATSGLTYSVVTPAVGKVYADGALVQANLYLENPLVDSNTVYAAMATRGMTELVTGTSLTNSGGVVITDGAFDFAAASSVLDFPITSAAKWLLDDFTVELVFTPCSPSHPYPSMIATGDAWENNSLSVRFGNGYSDKVGLFWNDVGDPVIIDGYLQYSNMQFSHIALCRSNDTITLYINGVATTTEYCNTQWDVASDNLIRLGALDIPDAKYDGKIRWARISNIARYSSNFDPSELINLM